MMRFKPRTIVSFLIIMIAFAILIGCEQSSDSKMAEQTEQMLSEANREMGLPNITNFKQKKTLKMIYEMCDKENIVCYAYIKSDYQGKLIFVGKCIGYGIPFSAQYSNPSAYKRVSAPGRTTYSNEVMPQAEPNGLFMPTSSSATWLLLVDPITGKPRPAYFEPEIVVSPFPLHKVEKPVIPPGKTKK